MLGLEKMVRGDIRKMFDTCGTPLKLSALRENEAAILEAFGCVEHYTTVRKADGSTEAVLTGRMRRYKFTPMLTVLREIGKAMGWYPQPKATGLEPTLEELVLGAMREE